LDIPLPKLCPAVSLFPPGWPPQCSCIVIESSFDPGERLQTPGSLRSFLRACKIITYRFFCIHVARFLLLCHICDCTFVTGVCKLKRFIDFANISIRTSCFFSLFVTKKTINITQPSKKTPKQSISCDCVAVTLARITF
jgi:hypothetical protein